MIKISLVGGPADGDVLEVAEWRPIWHVPYDSGFEAGTADYHMERRPYAPNVYRAVLDGKSLTEFDRLKAAFKRLSRIVEESDGKEAIYSMDQLLSSSEVRLKVQ